MFKRMVSLFLVIAMIAVNMLSFVAPVAAEESGVGVLDQSVVFVSNSEAVVQWTADRYIESYVEYGETQLYGSDDYDSYSTDSTGIYTFTARLLGLTENTEYHYRVVLVDDLISYYSDDFTFSTSSVTFQVTDVQVLPESNAVTFSWKTSVPTTSSLQFERDYVASPSGKSGSGSPLSYPATYNFFEDTNLSTDHTVSFAGSDTAYISEETQYLFLIRSADAQGNNVSYGPDYFSTPRGEYAVVTNLRVESITDHEATVLWDTDILTTTNISTWANTYGNINYSSVAGNWFQDENTNPSLNHQFLLTDLSSSREIDVSIRNTSIDGSETRSTTSFITLGCDSYYDVSVTEISSSYAKINWKTTTSTSSLLAISSIDGTVQRFFSSSNIDLTDHFVELTDVLEPQTIYYFEIVEVSSGVHISPEFSFETIVDEPIVEVIDTEAPSGTIAINNDDIYSPSTSLYLGLTATDNVEVVDMQLSSSALFEDAVWESYTSNATFYYSEALDHTKTMFAKFRDAAGNVSEVVSDSIEIDLESPIVSNLSTLENPTNNPRPTFDWQGYDKTSGISNYTISIGSFRFLDDVVAKIDLGVSTSFTPSFDLDLGQYYVTVTAVDNVGHTSSWMQLSILIVDTTSPVGSIEINSGYAETSSLSVILNISATDDLSDVVSMRLTNDPLLGWGAWETFSTEKSWNLIKGKAGAKYVYVEFRDSYGNVSATYLDSIDYVKSSVGGAKGKKKK